jgi:aryl-alcohol dehydrogenase-like predicted oxidoreductase
VAAVAERRRGPYYPDAMQTRPLGRTGWQVSAVGFGCWGLGNEMWRDGSPEVGRQALRLALETGATFVDTALIYSRGESEQMVGEVVREMRARDDVLVATKIPPQDGRWPPKPGVPLERVFSVEHVTRSVEQSLRNLRAEVLGVEQLHVWLDEWLDGSSWPELRGCMERLVREGKVLHWGVSVNDHAPDTALRMLDEPIVETVQVIYNIFDRGAEKELFARAAERKVGVIARCPFDEGALTGAIGPESRFDPADFRSRYFRGERAVEVAERVGRLRRLLGDEAKTLPELALRFCLSRPEVATVIPGMRKVAHVRSNLAAGDGRALSPALREELVEHAWDKNWYEWSKP